MTSTDDHAVFFNPLEPGYIEDPYPHVAAIRAADPVHWTLVERWALFRYDDVFRLLRDPDLSVDDAKAAPDGRDTLFETIAADEGVELVPSTSILGVDPPDHTRLRRLISKAFTPHTIEALRPHVEQLVDEALDRLEAAGGGDVVAELAFPLPFDVISAMLGMPDADKDIIRGWSEALVKTLDPIIDESEVRAALRAGKAMDAHIDGVVEWKRANPADDILTKMIEAEEDGDRLSAKELRDQVVLLFVAGHETTVNLIGTGIYELLRHPDQLQCLLDDPSLTANAIDELLRYVSPVQMSRRIATRDLEFGGRTIPSGSFVMAMLASANHDPEKFGPTADELDIRREGAGQHVAFGTGTHYSRGASLAKLEAQVAIGSYVRRFPRAQVVDAAFNGRLNLRGHEKLTVEL